MVRYDRGMKLADYMYQTGMTPGQLRAMLGVKSRSTVLRYISGERVPNGTIMAKIKELSGGRVTLRDFYDESPPKCIRILIDRHGEEHKVYPWTNIERRHQFPANDNHPPDSSGSMDGLGDVVLPPTDWSRPLSVELADPWPSQPLKMAIDELGSRVKPSKRRDFLLDGRLVDARRIVAEANRSRRERGLPPIPYPGVEQLK